MKHDVYDTGSAASRPRTEDKSNSGKPNADKQEMMKKAEAASAPGPGHKVLEHFVGNWKADVKCWMDPNGAPETSQATAKANWIMNGRFLQEDFKGEMMGKPFQGRTIMGFNNIKQAYQSVWVDDMNTAMFTNEGKAENGNKVITLEGKGTCPMTGRTDIPMKVVFRIQGPDKHTFEMFDGSKGENTKTMEIAYTRQ